MSETSTTDAPADAAQTSEQIAAIAAASANQPPVEQADAPAEGDATAPVPLPPCLEARLAGIEAQIADIRVVCGLR
jgi:hypothetical protein